ncbi:MAG: DUF1553 domain-containing protein [Verrucomicrobiaceae bacterium]|nr:DUF1553 domain-containing protein [Verrucomicrobiaceae bacterium]
MIRKTLLLLPTLASGWGGFSLIAAADAPLSFNRDVRPIIADACFQCHGPDSATREADLRLDTERGFFGGEGADPVVIPGKPGESSFYGRLVSDNPDDIMPPPGSHKELEPEEIAVIRRWIVEGAKWQPHWSFVAPESPDPSSLPKQSWGVNPIDRFVLARLAQAGLTPAPEADRRALLRRLALDLTGLPPTLEEVESFVTDEDPDAYEKRVDRYLASPRWGEHRSRYWLDAARYADTHGLHFDNYREMWPYRDWVIAAFNRNQPFDQFTVEQIAGDLLPDPSESQLVATGFQRCNMTTNEGGTIDEENLAFYASDRVQTLGWVYLGLTLNCAQCHDHKFDPITAKDYYAMAAFFRNTTQGPKDGNVKDSGPILVLPNEADRVRWDALPDEIAAASAKRQERRTAVAPEFQSWLATATPVGLEEDMPEEGLVAHLPLNEGKGSALAARIPAGARFEVSGELAWAAGGRFGRAPVLTKSTPVELGDLAHFARDEAFSIALWVRSPKDGFSGSLIARMDDRAAHRGWDILQENRNLAFHLIDTWPGNALKVTTTKAVLTPGRWQHLTVTYDGSGKAAGVRLYLNGVDTPLRTTVDKLRADAETRAATPLRLGQRSHGMAFEGGQVQDLRLFKKRLTAADAARLHALPGLHAALAADEKRKPEQAEALLQHYLAARDEAWQKLNHAVLTAEKERETIRRRSPVTHIQEEKKDSPAMAHILLRGAYDQVGELVAAAPPAVLHPLPDGAPANRLGLARWLVDPANPLTARVTVNRFWQQIFGTGIVATPDDFGIMGATPSHPELLDWLALRFLESGWDTKALFKTIVMSATYRQAALLTPEKLEKDRDNRLLSRGPRFRMDGEMIRDAALAASGLLSPRMGGPGTRPYQPGNVWETVGMGTAKYVQDEGEGLYRRTVYNFWKRMAPPASMEIFNAPNREVSCTKRDRTNTPLQALVILNDPQFVEAARHLATHALKESCGDELRALDLVARRVLSRPLREEETAVMRSSQVSLLSHYQTHPEDAAALLAVGESPADTAIAPPVLAAWTMLCNQLLNLDEAVNK